MVSTKQDDRFTKWVGIIVLFMALGAAATLAYNQLVQRPADLRHTKAELQQQIDANNQAIDKATEALSRTNANEARLEKLIKAVAAAKTPGDVKRAIEQFNHSANQSHGGDGSTQGTTSATPEPSPGRSPSPRHAGASPSPRSSPRASPRASPTPLVRVCVNGTLVGDKCLPSVHLRTLTVFPISSEQKGAAPVNGTLSAEAVALIIAALISPLVGWLNRLFAKNKWPTEVNAALAYGLTILGAVLSSVTLLSHQRWQYYVITIGTAFAMHVVSHTGYKNLGATVTPSDSASEGPPETVPPRTRRRRSTKGDAGGVAIGLLLGIAVFVVVVVLLGWFVSHWLWFLLLLVVLIVLTRNRSTV